MPVWVWILLGGGALWLILKGSTPTSKAKEKIVQALASMGLTGAIEQEPGQTALLTVTANGKNVEISIPWAAEDTTTVQDVASQLGSLRA